MSRGITDSYTGDISRFSYLSNVEGFISKDLTMRIGWSAVFPKYRGLPEKYIGDILSECGDGSIALNGFFYEHTAYYKVSFGMGETVTLPDDVIERNTRKLAMLVRLRKLESSMLAFEAVATEDLNFPSASDLNYMFGNVILDAGEYRNNSDDALGRFIRNNASVINEIKKAKVVHDLLES